MSIKQQTFNGLAWNLFSRSGQQFIRILSDIVLARLLTPDDFGTVGIAIAIVHLCKLPASFGIASTIVQLREERSGTLSTAFFFNVLAGVALFVLVQLSAAPLAGWYAKLALVDVVRWSGLIILFYAISIVQVSLLRRSMNFRKLATIGILSQLAGVVLGITSVLCGWGLMALVVKHVATELTYSCLLWLRPSWFPRFQFQVKELKELLSVGKYVFMAQSSDVILSRLSVLTVGGVFGTTTLGLMNKAESLSGLVTNYVSNSFKEVSFSSLSALQTNEQQFVNALGKLMHAVYFLAFGLAGFLFFAGADIIYIVLGEQWGEAVPIFHVLVLISPVMASNGILSFAFVAKGKSRMYFRFDLLKKLITVLTIVSAFYVVFDDFLIILVVAAGLKLILNHTVIAGKLGVSFYNRVSTLTPYLIIALLSAAPSILSVAFFEDGLFIHSAKAVVFAVIYTLTNLLLRTSGWKMFVEALQLALGKLLNRP